MTLNHFTNNPSEWRYVLTIFLPPLPRPRPPVHPPPLFKEPHTSKHYTVQATGPAMRSKRDSSVKYQTCLPQACIIYISLAKNVSAVVTHTLAVAHVNMDTMLPQ